MTDAATIAPEAELLRLEVPRLGYVKGNVRVVCNILNTAMNEWGIEAIHLVLDAVRTHQERT